MKKVGIVVKPDEMARMRADELEDWLQDQGFEVVRKDSHGFDDQAPGRAKTLAPSDLFCIFVLGGDGTFLSGVRWIGDQDIPILGVKFGQVGFLAETAAENLFAAATTVLKGEFTTQTRMRLQVRVIRHGKEIGRETVLNDVVVNKGALARLAHIEAYINEQYLTTYRADGLIVATPTGSTAYSLAAGGPVLHPSVPAVILTPICPFTLTNRPLIVPDSVTIKLKLEKEPSHIKLTFDGQKGLEINGTETIIVSKGPRPVHMISLPQQHYFDVLKTKLNWSGCMSGADECKDGQ